MSSNEKLPEGVGKKIVEALKKHDAGLAEKLANEHMMNTIHNMDNYGWDNLFQ